MGGSAQQGPLGNDLEVSPRTPGALGRADAASPDAPTVLTGDTPGALGRNDWGDPDHPAYGMRALSPLRLDWSDIGTFSPPFSPRLSLGVGDLVLNGTSDLSRPSIQDSAVEPVDQGGAGDPAGGLDAIIRALDEKRLLASMNDVQGQLRALAREGSWTDKNGNVMRAAAELINCLAGLVDKSATMTIMSMFRYKGGPHGQVQADGTGLGRAVDIMAYMGFNIHLKQPNNASAAISGVAAVISHLPPGKYTLGLPRPGGGKLFDPTQDVFLPVTNLDQVTKSPSRGNFRKDLAMVLEPAQTALRAAADGNAGAKIQFMYPDGVDHVHITTVP